MGSYDDPLNCSSVNDIVCVTEIPSQATRRIASKIARCFLHDLASQLSNWCKICLRKAARKHAKIQSRILVSKLEVFDSLWRIPLNLLHRLHLYRLTITVLFDIPHTSKLKCLTRVHIYRIDESHGHRPELVE